MSRLPRYLLYVESEFEPQANSGFWRFSLEAIESQEVLDAEDFEEAGSSQRLDLIGLVRGLEALDQPSQIQLVTESRYLSRGLRVGLPLWRENEWRWERFGEMTPIKDADLWQRVDHALAFHRIHTRLMRIDSAHHQFAAPHAAALSATAPHRSIPANHSHPQASLHSNSLIADEQDSQTTVKLTHRRRILLRRDTTDRKPSNGLSQPSTQVFRRSGKRNRLGVACGA